ncbi:hypothetical protein AVL62_13110 [Serinicoccus chungangensis]|uniref:Uncharacterized protein n=1 Tax=Serinicoccus chungangensis TaxID=767452 RepID=A0A0W8IBN4_9MICO|nr:hypothetical protein AVL62_13110 [Serinicoccus chungangensis]
MLLTLFGLSVSEFFFLKTHAPVVGLLLLTYHSYSLAVTTARSFLQFPLFHFPCADTSQVFGEVDKCGSSA